MSPARRDFPEPEDRKDPTAPIPRRIDPAHVDMFGSSLPADAELAEAEGLSLEIASRRMQRQVEELADYLEREHEDLDRREAALVSQESDCQQQLRLLRHAEQEAEVLWQSRLEELADAERSQALRAEELTKLEQRLLAWEHELRERSAQAQAEQRPEPVLERGLPPNAAAPNSPALAQLAAQARVWEELRVDALHRQFAAQASLAAAEEAWVRALPESDDRARAAIQQSWQVRLEDSLRRWQADLAERETRLKNLQRHLEGQYASLQQERSRLLRELK